MEASTDLQSWQEADDPTATRPSTTISLGIDAAFAPRLYLRVVEL